MRAVKFCPLFQNSLKSNSLKSNAFNIIIPIEAFGAPEICLLNQNSLKSQVTKSKLYCTLHPKHQRVLNTQNTVKNSFVVFKQ